MSEPIYCINHPNVETGLRCNKCGKPICVKCVVATPVGYRCRNCINRQQQVFYADFQSSDYLIAAAVALPLSLIAGWFLPDPRLSWYVIILGPLAGTGIAALAHRAIGRRRGQYTWLVVGGCIVVGALPRLFVSLLSFLMGSPIWAGSLVYSSGGLMELFWTIVYLAGAVGTAYANLRPGRRV